MATKPAPLLSHPVHEVWERWIQLWHISFYIMLAVLVGVTLTQGIQQTDEHLLIVVLSALLGVWYGISLPLKRNFWVKNPLFSLVYFGVGWGLWIALINVDGIFAYLLFGMYPQLCIKLPVRQCIVGIWALTACLIWIDLRFDGISLSNLMSGLGTGFLTSILKLFIEGIIVQNVEHRLLIEKLEATRAELAAAERQAGVLGERQRLAGEIHDTLAQGFTSIVIQLEAAESSLPPHLTTVRQHLDQARLTARESLGEARRLVWALQPEPLERSTLAQAITRITARWTEGCAIPAQALITGQPYPLRPEVEVTLLRAAQEGLANIRKYAQAKQVRLTLSYMDDMVMLDVQDDGVGFAPDVWMLQSDAQDSGGYGLRAMRARVEQLGGKLLVESAPGEGTTLAISMPALVEQALITPMNQYSGHFGN